MPIHYTEADASTLKAIVSKWRWVREAWLHVEGGFTLVACEDENIAGFISIRWRELPAPLQGIQEGFIDIIEVDGAFRRRGVARELIDLSERKCRERGACQISAWSSEDKTEAIPMWHSLGFGLCPATDHPGGTPVRGYFVAKRLPG